MSILIYLIKANLAILFFGALYRVAFGNLTFLLKFTKLECV
jgi:hypothetical protein